MLAKILKRAGIGFLIGIAVGNLIAVLTGTSSSGGVSFASKQLLDMAGGDVVISMVLQSLFSGLYGALCFAGTVLYDIDRMPLTLATALHCGIIILTFIPIGLFLGWVGDIITILIMASMQLAAFFIIWIIMYLVYKKQIRELNELMDKSKNQDEDK